MSNVTMSKETYKHMIECAKMGIHPLASTVQLRAEQMADSMYVALGNMPGDDNLIVFNVGPFKFSLSGNPEAYGDEIQLWINHPDGETLKTHPGWSCPSDCEPSLHIADSILEVVTAYQDKMPDEWKLP